MVRHSRSFASRGIAAAVRIVRERTKDVTRAGAAVHDRAADRHQGCASHLSPAERPASAGARGRFDRCRQPREFLALARSVRLRQVDAALSDRRLPADRERQASMSRASRLRRRVPTVASCSSISRCFPWKTRAGERALRARAHGARRARSARSARNRSSTWLGLNGFEDSYPIAAFRRHEAAHGARPHARLRSENPAHGRAVRRARRADPKPDAGGIAPHLAAHAQDGDLRHPRRAGGGLSRRPRGGDVGAARTDQGDRRYQVRQE